MAMALVSRAHRNRPRRGGFSLIETIVGLALLLIIALGMLPLFISSSVNNVSGKEATEVTNLGRSELEEFRQLPFNSPRLTIDAGSEKTLDEYYSFNDKQWKPGPAPTDGSDPPLWTRTATVRQFAASAVTDGVLDADEALPAGTSDSFVHLKEIQITIDGERRGALGPAKSISLRVLKSQ